MNQTVENYNKMVHSLDQRVLVSIRKFKELGATSEKELVEPKVVDHIPVGSQNSVNSCGFKEEK